MPFGPPLRSDIPCPTRGRSGKNVSKSQVQRYLPGEAFFVEQLADSMVMGVGSTGLHTKTRSSALVEKIPFQPFESNPIYHFRGRITTRASPCPRVEGRKGEQTFVNFTIGSRAEPTREIRSYFFTGPESIQYRRALGAMGINFPQVCLYFHYLRAQC